MWAPAFSDAGRREREAVAKGRQAHAQASAGGDETSGERQARVEGMWEGSTYKYGRAHPCEESRPLKHLSLDSRIRYARPWKNAQISRAKYVFATNT